MKGTSEELLADLEKRTKENIAFAKKLEIVSIEALLSKEKPNSWNALECLAHLNLYGDFYLPEISKRIRESAHKADPLFRSGILGNYFAKSLLPKEKLNKMKTFKDKNPIGTGNLSIDILVEFLEQQQQLLELLHKSKKVSLTKTKTAISSSTFLKLRLGDTFRVVIYHNQRHLAQASKALATANIFIQTGF